MWLRYGQAFETEYCVALKLYFSTRKNDFNSRVYSKYSEILICLFLKNQINILK